SLRPVMWRSSSGRRRAGTVRSRWLRSLWSMSVFVCTSEDRLEALERVDGSWTARAALEGLGAQCVATDGTRVLVGTRGHGLFVSDDAGERWDHAELGESRVVSVPIGADNGAGHAR